MFEWCKQSTLCYAYLVDVKDFDEEYDVQFTKSRWFTRGWTLQGLLAPKQILFLENNWNPIGDRTQLTSLMSAATNIDIETIKCPLAYLWDKSVACKMSWASQRETTRKEDMAYYVLGIFSETCPSFMAKEMEPSSDCKKRS
jgi:hypothetical protein